MFTRLVILTVIVASVSPGTIFLAIADNSCQEAPPEDRARLPAKLQVALDPNAYLLRLLPTDETYWEVPVGLTVERTGDACHPDGLPFTISLESTTHPGDQRPTIIHDFQAHTWTIKFDALQGPNVHVIIAGNDDNSAFKRYQIGYLGKVRGPILR